MTRCGAFLNAHNPSQHQIWPRVTPTALHAVKKTPIHYCIHQVQTIQYIQVYKIIRGHYVKLFDSLIFSWPEKLCYSSAAYWYTIYLNNTEQTFDRKAA